MEKGTIEIQSLTDPKFGAIIQVKTILVTF